MSDDLRQSDMLAYLALQGDEDVQYLLSYVKEMGLEGHISHLVQIAIALAIDPDGASEYQLKVVRRKAGKPVQRRARARRGRRGAALIESLVSRGMKQEAAIAQVSNETGLSRTELFEWLKNARQWRDHYERMSGQKPE